MIFGSIFNLSLHRKDHEQHTFTQEQLLSCKIMMQATSSVFIIPSQFVIFTLQALKSYWTHSLLIFLLPQLILCSPLFTLPPHLPPPAPQHLQKYRNAPRTQNPPHVYATADAAYQQMVASGRNQCCVISGESGAGKTESCKFIVAELMELSHSKSVLETKILQACDICCTQRCYCFRAIIKHGLVHPVCLLV